MLSHGEAELSAQEIHSNPLFPWVMLYLPGAKYPIYWTLTSALPEIFRYQSNETLYAGLCKCRIKGTIQFPHTAQAASLNIYYPLNWAARNAAAESSMNHICIATDLVHLPISEDIRGEFEVNINRKIHYVLLQKPNIQKITPFVPAQGVLAAYCFHIAFTFWRAETT